MKLSVKMSLLSIGLSAVTLLLCGVIVLRAVYVRSMDAAKEDARNRLGYVVDAFAFSADWEGTDTLSERAAKNRYQYLFRRLDRNGEQSQLVYRGETLYNSAGLMLDAVLGEASERLIEMDGRYGIVLGQTLDNACSIYLYCDCTDRMEMLASLKVLLLSVFGAVFALMGSAILLLTHAALSPLKELERAARRMAAGNYETPISVQHRDEVGSLAQSFETMRRAVQAHTGLLSEVAEERKMLLGALTHEMKTPLTAIVGYSEALQTLRLSETQRRDCIAYLYRESKRLERLTQKMIRLITVSGGEPFDASAISGQTLENILRPMLYPIAERRGVLLTMDLDSFATVGDADLLCSVVSNLFDNAASAGAKNIEIKGRGATLSVTDDGTGMTPEVLARVTEPFYRADKARSRSEGHAGLGLALVQRIVEQHGGKLSLESTVGVGTTVTVSLPTGKEVLP